MMNKFILRLCYAKKPSVGVKLNLACKNSSVIVDFPSINKYSLGQFRDFTISGSIHQKVQQ